MELKSQFFALSNSWTKLLREEFDKEYINSLDNFIHEEISKGKTVYPKVDDIFSAFKVTPIEKVKVVILGQDPYHGDNQAHGMSFSVLPEVKLPPSLRNIYKELESDLGITPATHGHLIKWSNQGVLLLNAVLTVERGIANSHKKRGWELFTDRVIEILNQRCENLVFILWGNPAQKKGKNVDTTRHCVLTSSHPSPLGAYKSFFGSRPFSKANKYLLKHNITPIDWSVE